jgi:two-component system response regulator HydG
LFRLNVIAVAIPPLESRREDIMPLALRFVGEFATKFERVVLGFTTAGEEALLAHSYPGNFRELRNRIERAVALGDGPWLDVGDLFSERQGPEREGDGVRTLAQAREGRGTAATSCGFSARRTATWPSPADRLDVSRSTLFEKIKRLGLRS